MTARHLETAVPVLLDVEQVAIRLGTKPRFVRRLIAERRIEFHKVGRYVRISEATLAEFIKASRVEPMTLSESQHKTRGVALCRTEQVIDVSATSGSESPAVSRFAIRGLTAVCVPVLTPMSVRATPSER